MTPTILFTLGTPHGTWPALAEALLHGAPAGIHLQQPAFKAWLDEAVGDGAVAAESVVSTTQLARLTAMTATAKSAGVHWGGMDARAVWTLAGLQRQLPQARFLMFFDDPVTAVAASAASQAGLDEVLHDWRLGAQRLLRHAQGHLDRCLLIDAAEARRHPQALAAQVSAWAGVELRVPTAVAVAPADPLCQLIAQAVVAGDGTARALSQELQASCAVLGEGDAAVAGLPGVGAAAAAQALQRLQRRLVALEGQAGVLATERDRLKDELQHACQKLASTRTEGELLIRQLQQTQEEFETLDLKCKGLQAQIAQGKTAAGTTAPTARTAVAAPATDQRGETRHADVDVLRADLAKARQEADFLLPQLHHVQEELVLYYNANQALEKRLAAQGGATALPGRPGLVVTRVVRGAAIESAPHRQLGFVLHQVRLGQRSWPRLEVRLVEHRGHPGLVLVQEPGASAPLSSWQETGKEGTKAFVLLIPADANTQAQFQRMPTGDWELVEALAHFMAANLTDAPPLPRWSRVARALSLALAEMPQRLRYDGLTVTKGDDKALDLTFARVLHGARHFERVALRWWPAGRAGAASVVMLAPAKGEALPLTMWPVGDDGVPQAEWPLPLEDRLSASELRLQWSRLAAGDRQFLLALLDALPAAAHHAKGDALPTGLDTARLATAAALPLRRVRRALGLTRAGRALRALLGRPALAS